MRGAIPPLPNTHSWRGAQLKHRDNFTFIIEDLEHSSRCPQMFCDAMLKHSQQTAFVNKGKSASHFPKFHFAIMSITTDSDKYETLKWKK
jgi:hypothetical protein